MFKDKALNYFFLLSFGFCWFWAAMIYFSEIPYGSVPATLIVALGCMSAPALSAWIVTRYIIREPLSSLGVNWKTARKKILFITPLWLAVWIGAFFLVIWLSGNVFGIEQIGSIDFTYDSLLNRIEDLTQGQLDPEALNIPPVPVVLALVVAGGIIAGCSINLLFALGEEIGWRGFVYNRLERHGVHARNLLTGFAWGLWHAPLILMGHNFPGEPVAGVFMMVLFCIALSYPMDWLRKHSNTVLAPAAFHGMINGSAAGLMLFVNAGHELIGSVVGLAGLLAVLAVYLMQNLLSRPAGG